MADGSDLSEILRRTVQANARFYKGWVDLSLEYFRGISEIFGVASPAVAAGESVTSAASNALVMEGEEGATVRGAFLVTNDLGRNVSCEFVASPFRDAAGAVVRAKPTFEPARMELAPGEQRVVHAVIDVDPKLVPGVGYTGEISIKGMDGISVPMVLRRLHRIEDSPIDRAAASASSPAAPSAQKSATRTAVGKTGRKVARRKRGRTNKAPKPQD